MRVAESLFKRYLHESKTLEALEGLSWIWCRHLDECKPHLGLALPEFNVHLFLCYQGEVGNGGHCQYFMNSTSDRAAETLDALRAVGLDRAHAILQRACSLFPGGMPPRDWNERNALMESFSERELALWAEADRAFYAIDLAELDRALAYLRAHGAHICLPERGLS